MLAEVESELFDTEVGRFVLQFVPDPVAALQSLSIDSSRRGPCLPGGLLRPLSCAFRALATLVRSRLDHS